MVASDAQINAFLARQRELLKKERDAEIERSSLLLTNCGPKLLEQKGLALNGLGVANINIGLGGKTLVELERPPAYHTSPTFPPHTFRPGDLARIEANVSTSGPSKKAKKAASSSEETRGSAPEGVVYKVSDTRIVVAVETSDNANEDLDIPERCRVVKLANSVTYDRMEKAIDTLEKRALGQDDKTAAETLRLTQVLLGIVEPSPPKSLPEIQFFGENLNSSQKAAIQFCLEAQEVACIHGPPGTGKTHTLIELIRQMTSATPANPKPLRLLVCGASNLSVDNILERLLALPSTGKGDKIKVTRLGHPARVMAHEGILDATLEMQATRSDQAALAKDVKNELDSTLGILSGKGKGAKGKAPRGLERKKLWEEVRALRKEYRQREGGVVKSVLSEAQVVIATCHTAGSRQLFNHQFDVVIIDEATQAMEAVCWVPIFKAKKLILAGDPMQLPPTILSLNTGKEKKSNKKAAKPEKKTAAKKAPKHEDTKAEKDDNPISSESADEDEEPKPDEAMIDEPPMKNANAIKLKNPELHPPSTLETTLFDRLEKMYGPGIKRMLTIQYRMHEQICTFPSETLYYSRLESHSSVKAHLLKDLPNASSDDEDGVLSTPVVFFDTAGSEYFERVDSNDGDEGSKCNENEATVVKSWVEKLIEAGLSPEQIAVITPYQAQVTLLSSLLRPTYGTALEIGSVDGMQGREKEAVVISLVRSNDKREVGFLKEKRRLNVAMTRARRHLCVIGDSSTVSHGGGYLKKWLSWLDSNANVRYAGLD